MCCRVQLDRAREPTASAAARPAQPLREFFEVDYRYVIVATLAALARDGKLDASIVDQAIKAHNINPEKSNPAAS